MTSSLLELEAIFGGFLKTSVQASVLIILILAVQGLFRNRLSARCRAALWMVLLIRLAVPWTPSSPVSLFNWLPLPGQRVMTSSVDSPVAPNMGLPTQTSPARTEEAALVGPAVEEPVVEPTETIADVSPLDGESSRSLQGDQGPTTLPATVETAGNVPRTPRSALDTLPWLWLIGAIGLAAYTLLHNLLLWLRVRALPSLMEPNVLNLLEDTKAAMGVRANLAIVPTQLVRGPALFGFIHPRLLVPRQLVEQLSLEELRYVFLHELGHVRRHDIAVNWLMTLLQCLHWFNPLVWFAAHRIRADRELACDALALSHAGEDKQTQYGRAIVTLLERFAHPPRIAGVAGILEGKSQLRQRMHMIAEFKQGGYRMSAFAVALLVGVGVVGLTGAQEAQQPTPPTPGATADAPKQPAQSSSSPSYSLKLSIPSVSSDPSDPSDPFAPIQYDYTQPATLNDSSITAAATEEDWKQKLPQAEAQLQTVFKELESRLDPAQKTKLQAAEEAWQRYRELALDSFIKEHERHGRTSGNEHADAEFSASLVWSRVSHLNRMLEPRELNGSDSDFRDADETLNKVYQDKQKLLFEREAFEALKQAERAWIAYRDAAADSESSVCPNPVSAALYVKTELTYERASFFDPRVFRLVERLSSAPPDLEKEFFLAQLLSGNADIRQKAIDFFQTHADESLPLLIAQIKVGMLPTPAVPIFEKLGVTAILPLLELVDNASRPDDELPAFLAAVGPAVVPELIPRVSSANPAVSEMSIAALGKLGSNAKDAIPALMEIIRKPDSGKPEWAWQRGAAAQAVLGIAPDNPEVAKAIVDAYVAAPTDDETFVYLLSRLGPAAKEALPILIEKARPSEKAQTSETCYAARPAIEAIITPEDTQLIPSLIEGLVDPHISYWEYFGRALAKMGDPVVPPLMKLLQNKDILIVRRAAATLAMLKPPPDDVVTALITLMNREDPIEAVFFIDAVAALQESAKAAVPALLNLYRSGKPAVSAAAAHALHSIAPNSDDVKGIGFPDPFVTDPYYDAGCYRESEHLGTRGHYALKADFNNDGVEDVAISTGGFGNGGGPWNLYLKVADRKYKRLCDFGAPTEVNLFTKEKGAGYMGVYWHMSAATGTERLYKITMDEFTEVKSVDVQWDDAHHETPVDSTAQLPRPEGYTVTRLTGEPIEKESLLGN